MGLFDFFKKKKAVKTETETKKATNTVEKTSDTQKTTPVPKNEVAEPKKETALPQVNEKPTAKALTNQKKDTEANVELPKEEPKNKEKNDAKGAFTGKFEINKSKDGKKYFFNLYASNKVGIATSQMYSSAQSALTGVKSVIANAEKASIEDQTLKTVVTMPYPKWEIYIDNGNKFRFRLNAANGSCVCHSQGYTTKTACKNGIDSIIRSSKNAEIVKTYITKKDEE